jgi:aryl-alcohol dehydrogenase-like predicted oxidoreductase
VLYVGVSEWRAEEISAALAIAAELGLDRIVSNQPEYNMIWRVIESEVVPLCTREGISQIVWAPIAQGTLTGKYLPGSAPPAGSRATDDRGGSECIAQYLTDDILGRVQQLRPVADEAGLTLAQLAVAWTLQNPNVASAIVGASRPEQIRENVRAAGVTLDKELLRRIDEILSGQTVTDPAKTASPAVRP